MIRPTAIELNGLRVGSSADSLVVDYVYPGTIDIHVVHGITLKTTGDAKSVRLGRLLTKRTAERIMDDRSWQWEPNAVAKTRAWVQHVLLADSLQQSQSYELEGQVVLVGHRLPPRAAEVSLYAAGFRPSLATWRAAATDERRERLPELVRALGGDAAASAAQLAAPTEQPKERAQHVWMRWHAIFQTALDLGGRPYQMRGRPTLYDNELEIELRHASSKSKLTLRFDVSKHPVLFGVNLELGEDRQQRELLAWEDLPSLTEEISAAITAQTKGRRSPATTTREVRPRAGAEALKQLARRLHALLTGSVRIGGHRYHSPLGEVVGDHVEVSFNSDGPYRLTLYVAPRPEREVDLRGELAGEDGVTIARFDSTVIQLSELIAMNETSFVRWFGIPAVPERKLAPTEDAPFEEARSALKALGLPPKKYAYYLRRAEEAIGDGKAYAPIVARARRAAEKLSGVTNPATPAARPPKDPPDAGVPAIDVTLDTFNTQPGWRAQQVRSRANGFVLAVFPEGRDMDAAAASVDVIDGEIDEVRWLDERVTQSVRDLITGRLERALWAAYQDGEAGDGDEDTPRPSPLQDLIDLMERRGRALGARAVNTADLGRKDGYANIASALRDLARPTGPTAEDLQRWLEAAELMSAGEIVGRARGAGATSVRQLMRDLWAAVFEVLTREQVAGRPGALRASAEAIFHDDDGDFVLQRVHQGDREVVRRVRVRVGELDEDTDEVQVEDPTERLASGATLHRAERPEQFFIDLYGKLGAFHDDLERAPRTLQDVRTLLYWAAVMLDAPLCQGEVKARAAVAFTQAKAFYDTARRALIEGRSVDAVRRMHEALARISSAAAEIARICAEGQIEITVTPPHLPVLPADKVAINGLTSLRWRDDEPMRRPPETPAAPQVAMQAHRHVAVRPPVAMAGADRPRRSAAQADTRGRIDWDTIAAESERRVSEREGELVAMMDRLTRIYSGGRLAGKRVRPGTIVVERVNGTPEFPSLVLPNLASIADGIDVGAAVAIVGLMPLEIALAGWIDRGGEPTPEGERLTAALEGLGTETSQEAFEAARDALWEEAERAGVALEIAWRLYAKSGPTSRTPAVATSLPSIPARVMPHLRYLLELHLRQIPSDAHSSVISRWVRPPHDHIEAGEGAWQRVLNLISLDHSTCSRCPFVLGSNLDCETCRTWVLSLKRPGAPWTAERIGAALYNCDEPAVATATVEALAQSTQAPLTAAFFRDFADNFEVRLAKHVKRPEDMDPGNRDHCRKAVEWLLPQPDFPLPEYPPSNGTPRSVARDILMRAAPVSAGWRY